jgi:alpha-tubulin suppressor-like RCC1 family protein
VLGDGTTVNSATPVAVRDLSDVVELTAAFDSSCALHRNGQVSCWGHNHDGQLGDGTKVDSPTPILVPDLSNAVHIASDVTTVCALLEDHTVDCWGYRMEP